MSESRKFFCTSGRKVLQTHCEKKYFVIIVFSYDTITKNTIASKVMFFYGVLIKQHDVLEILTPLMSFISYPISNIYSLMLL